MGKEEKNGCNDATGDNSERDSRGALISTTPGGGFRGAKGFCFHCQRGETNLNGHPNAHKRKSHDDPWAPMPERGRGNGWDLVVAPVFRLTNSGGIVLWSGEVCKGSL